MLDEWFDNSLIKVSDEIEGEVLGIIEECLVSLHDKIVVEFLHILALWSTEELIALIDCTVDRILIYHIWVLALIGQISYIGILQILETLLVLADSIKLLIDELEEGLQILWSRSTRKAVVIVIHEDISRSLLTGKSLVEFGIREITKSTGS